MRIANPIYDVVFKRLMENERVVKFFIGTLLDEEVITVSLKPQEYTITKEAKLPATITIAALTIYRVDFVATIRLKDGSYKKVLIEIQKAHNKVDLMRFRNYLADQYKKKDEVAGRKVALPITTIYILGFNLPHIESACVTIDRQYRDRMKNKTLDVKEEFIELLTHDCHIVQVNRIDSRYQTRLDKLLSLFEQSYFINEIQTLKNYEHTIDDQDVATMADILHYLSSDAKARELLDKEAEANRTIDEWFGEQSEIIARQAQALEQKDELLEQKDELLTEQAQALEEKERLIAELLRKLEQKDENA